jgi:hypothetical protein
VCSNRMSFFQAACLSPFFLSIAGLPDPVATI